MSITCIQGEQGEEFSPRGKGVSLCSVLVASCLGVLFTSNLPVNLQKLWTDQRLNSNVDG